MERTPTTGIISLDIVLGALVCIFVFCLIARERQIPKGIRLPPGPPRKFFFGNAHDMPKHHGWETFERWANEYGKLVYVKVFRNSMVFVNSLDAARDLFEKRSSIYSDRFDFPMLIDLMGWEWNLGLMPYGERWRRHRKAFHQGFNSSAAVFYHPIHMDQTRTLLRRLRESPEDFVEHLRHLAGATIMKIVYGIEILPSGDPYIMTAEKAMNAISNAGNPGTYLVDTLPFLKYLPEWMPGAGFQKQARIWREPTVAMSVVPFAAVKNALNARTAEPSFIASSLEKLAHLTDALPDEEEVIRNAGAVAYAAGSDTTVAALTIFILAMVLHPEVQRKAQAELDSIVGMSRLPSFEDRESLPYINALCHETHRWHPVLPLCVAHRVMQDDVYGEYFIPGGSVVFINAWAILHDENTYGPRPTDFEPERFLKPGIEAPTAHFGLGRRVCPGRYMADNSMWIAVASILHQFDITPASDRDGNTIPIGGSFTSGLISHPEPFRCAIKPRAASIETLIHRPSN